MKNSSLLVSSFYLCTAQRSLFLILFTTVVICISFVLYVTALTYFLTKSTVGSEPQCSGDYVQSFVQTYLDKYPDCQHILAPLELEREKRNQDLVSFNIAVE